MVEVDAVGSVVESAKGMLRDVRGLDPDAVGGVAMTPNSSVAPGDTRLVRSAVGVVRAVISP